MPNEDVDRLKTSNNPLAEQIKQFHTFLEETPAIYVLISAFIFGLATLSTLISIYTTLFPIWGTWISLVILLSLLGAVLVVDYKHFRMLDNRRKEILKRDQHIRSLLDAMAFQTNRIEIPYKNLKLKYVYQIFANGDGYCVREATISPIEHPVRLITIRAGSTVIRNSVDTAELLKMIVRGYDQENGQSFPLLHYPIEDAGHLKRFAIVLDSPLDLGQQTQVIASHNWPNLWRELIEKGEDNGRILIEHDIEELEVNIRAPEGFEITAFLPNPKIGNPVIVRESNINSVVKWKVIGLHKGTTLFYRVVMHRQ